MAGANSRVTVNRHPSSPIPFGLGHAQHVHKGSKKRPHSLMTRAGRDNHCLANANAAPVFPPRNVPGYCRGERTTAGHFNRS